MSRLAALLVSAFAAIAIAACGGDDSGGSGDQKTAAETTSATTGAGGGEVGCKDVEAPEPKEETADKPKGDLDEGKTYRVEVTTSCGAFTIELDTKSSPKATASFVSLAEQGFYDSTVFHRIVPGFVIQGGDPLGNGMGGPGYSTTDTPPEDTTYEKGVVAMAKAGDEPPGTAGSQFFVVTGADAGLPPEYAPLGRVVEGAGVVDAIGMLGDAATQEATKVVTIDGMKVETE